jgi:hypothetical protein
MSTSQSQTPLAIFVRARLDELDLRQSDFCRDHQFDQGLLSKIMGSVVDSLSLESILRLAIGLDVPTRTICELVDRPDLHDLMIKGIAAELVIESRESTTPLGNDWHLERIREIAEKPLVNGRPKRRRGGRIER